MVDGLDLSMDSLILAEGYVHWAFREKYQLVYGENEFFKNIITTVICIVENVYRRFIQWKHLEYSRNSFLGCVYLIN